MSNAQSKKTISHERPLGYEGDWSLVPPEKRTRLQKIAAKTKGWLTAGNLVSVAGATLTIKGLYDYTQGHALVAVAEIGVGRLLDLADGATAKITKTRGEAGAFVDSALDKVLAAIGLVALTLTGDLPAVISIPALATQGYIAKANKDIHNHGGNPTPSRLGKYAMAGLSAFYISPVAAAAAADVGLPQLETAFYAGGMTAGVVSVALSALAAHHYHTESHNLLPENTV